MRRWVDGSAPARVLHVASGEQVRPPFRRQHLPTADGGMAALRPGSPSMAARRCPPSPDAATSATWCSASIRTSATTPRSRRRWSARSRPPGSLWEEDHRPLRQGPRLVPARARVVRTSPPTRWSGSGRSNEVTGAGQALLVTSRDAWPTTMNEWWLLLVLPVGHT